MTSVRLSVGTVYIAMNDTMVVLLCHCYTRCQQKTENTLRHTDVMYCCQVPLQPALHIVSICTEIKTDTQH